MSLSRPVIPLSQLGEGVSAYTFRVPLSSLKESEDPRFPVAVEVDVKVTPVEGDYYTVLDIRTVARLVCDRCAEICDVRLQGHVETLFTLDAVKAGEEDDFRLLSPDSAEIDLSQDILDALILAVPEKILCKADCQGLCDQCGTNLNEQQCGCRKTTQDPRWDRLKDIKFED